MDCLQIQHPTMLGQDPERREGRCPRNAQKAQLSISSGSWFCALSYPVQLFAECACAGRLGQRSSKSAEPKYRMQTAVDNIGRVSEAAGVVAVVRSDNEFLTPRIRTRNNSYRHYQRPSRSSASATATASPSPAPSRRIRSRTVAARPGAPPSRFACSAPANTSGA